MGRYSPIAIFEKEPVVIAGAIRSILFVLVLANVLPTIDEKLLAAIALGLELLLGLFVRGSSTPTAAPTLASGTKVTVETSEGEANKVVTV